MSDIPVFEAPGRLIDIGTHQMHYHVMGNGLPTIILEAGAGQNLLTWQSIQDELANFAHIFMYDRSGLGWSERGTRPMTSPAVAEELHALLAKAEISPPYILVGHSLGGVLIREFYHQYPNGILGLVFIDTSHEDQYTKLSKGSPELATKFAHVVETMVTTFNEAVDREFGDVLQTAAGIDLETFMNAPQEQQIALERLHPRNSQFRTLIEENQNAENFVQQGEEALKSLGNLPIVTLTSNYLHEFAGMGFSESEMTEFMAIWHAMHAEITTLSTATKQVFVDAGHFIQNEQPEVVINAIKELYDQVK